MERKSGWATPISLKEIETFKTHYKEFVLKADKYQDIISREEVKKVEPPKK